MLRSTGLSKVYCRTAVTLMLCATCCSGGGIYSLNESEYRRMPALYALDEYEPCLQQGGPYCLLDADLLPGTDSSLMDLIQGYSAHRVKHFNHTQIHRGVCLSTSCAHVNRTALGIERALTQCLNQTVSKAYGLQVKLAKLHYCVREGESSPFDASDHVVAVLYLLVMLLNAVGSCYDLIICKNGKGNPYLLSFSVQRNWKRLVSPSHALRDPRLDRLKAFHGIRTLTMLCVLFSHTVLIMAYSYVDNPLYIEKAYDDPLKQILFNGTLVTHTFFVMSSFLLAYNFQIYAETHDLTWTHLPKAILLRWLRLTPTYGLVLATISTLGRHAGAGPLWGLVVGSEAAACRRYWWAHLLYINNYIYEDAFCAPQTWYLAADTQLFCVGVAVCVGARRPRVRAVCLAVLLLLSLLTPALHTYLQHLDAVVLQSPETYRNLYEREDTFRLLYIRGHTNLSTYTLGLAGGFLAYRAQTQPQRFTGYKKHRWLVWLLLPLGVAVILSGGIFYRDGVEPPTALRVMYAALYKPIFQLLVVALILSCVLKLENSYRAVVEWRGWGWSGRVSFSAFLLHTLFQRGLVGSQTTPLHISDYYVVTVLCATAVMSYVCGCALYVCVEAPSSALTRALFGPHPPRTPRTRPAPLSTNKTTSDL
ncbi:nose resistant to fluoxetine protein 6-like isoform X1 [Bombyx mandarina]|uniref:Nose resistant to fluoxetine protein 6-like isoform X1 n=2 Tax=Bombyx mandarina TaxID=7092 RepID=A0A6J2JIV3_BOMMA|nr:nose resistant to fluoxetine protein 6-like isoform X1 [Bombyx mandarina]